MSPFSIARRVLWSAAAALFGVLLFSLAAIDHVPAVVSGFFIALAAGSAWRPAIGLALTSIRVDKLHEPNDLLRSGMSGYLLPFVIVSMHLLVVLIGAAYLARAKRKRTVFVE